MSVEPGQHLGRYRIEAEVGRGAMGRVYRALDEELGRTVAIKILPPYFTDTPTFVDRFRREARTAAGLRHHAIVAIFDVGLEHGQHYLVMEFLPGRSLADLIAEQGPLDPRRALSLVRQVGGALDHAHQRGVIHRDVKPANIIVSDAGHATLTDFGIAHAAASERLTMSGGIIGTPAYIAPEQALGRPVDGRADLYALAVVLWETLAGTVPFEADSAPAVLLAHAYHTPPTIRDLRPELPTAIEHVLDRALAKDPADRYRTGAELADALEAALFPEAKPPTLVQDSDAQEERPVATSTTPLTETRAWPRPDAPRDRTTPGAMGATAAHWSRGGGRRTVRRPHGSHADAGPMKRLGWAVAVAAVLILAIGIWRFLPLADVSSADRPTPQPTPGGAPTTVPTPPAPAQVAAKPAAPPPAQSATARPTATTVPPTAPTSPAKVLSPVPATAVPTRPNAVIPTATALPPTAPAAAPAVVVTATPVPTSPPAGRPTEPPVILPPRPAITPPATATPAVRPKPTAPAPSPTPGSR